MKKRMFILFLALFIGSQPTIPVQAESMEEVTEEASQETEKGTDGRGANHRKTV